MMKKVILLAVALIAGFACNTQAQILYRISGKGLESPSYIVGTYHLAPASFADSIPGMAKAWEALGWNVLRINGHNMEEIVSALERARDYRGAPTCIMADTVKGKGVSFMEFDNAWHQKVPTEAQYKQAVKELEEERKCL